MESGAVGPCSEVFGSSGFVSLAAFGSPFRNLGSSCWVPQKRHKAAPALIFSAQAMQNLVSSGIKNPHRQNIRPFR